MFSFLRGETKLKDLNISVNKHETMWKCMRKNDRTCKLKTIQVLRERIGFYGEIMMKFTEKMVPFRDSYHSWWTGCTSKLGWGWIGG